MSVERTSMLEFTGSELAVSQPSKHVRSVSPALRSTSMPLNKKIKLIHEKCLINKERLIVEKWELQITRS